MQSFPNNPMDLIRLQDRILKEVDITSIMGYSIFEGAKTNPKGTIQMVKDQALDNYKSIEKIVGKELLKDILNYNQ